MSEHDHLIAMLNRLKLTALRDQLDNLIDEAGRRDMTIRDALALFCDREIARRDQRRIDMSFGLARFPFVRAADSPSCAGCRAAAGLIVLDGSCSKCEQYHRHAGPKQD